VTDPPDFGLEGLDASLSRRTSRSVTPDQPLMRGQEC
jgi:hypothetical protein